MSKFSKVISLFLFMIFMGVCAYAVTEINVADVNDIVKKIKAGDSFNQTGEVTDFQMLHFYSGSILYTIDVKARLCYGGTVQGGRVLVPCKAIKDGYPLFAPIITWEK